MSSQSSLGASRLPAETTPYFTWPGASRGTVLFSNTKYNRAHEILLKLNFATASAAAKSTKKWKDEIAVLGGVEEWSWTVVGKKQSVSTSSSVNGTTTATLVGVRKKRKPDVGETGSAAPAGIQVLGDGLARKKAKMRAPPME